MNDPINFACRFCGTAAGDQCRTVKGRNKAMCRGRGTQPDPAEASLYPEAAPAPAPIAAAIPDDFDADTPPPKGRPRGLPLPRIVTLPPGEDVAGIFRQWDREGRVPAGSVLCEFAPFTAMCQNRDPYTIVRAPDAPREPDLDGFRIVVEVRREPSPAVKWVVMAPIGGRA